ncbi:MAG: hypothetical protein ACLFVO_25750 [Chloroflexaceae bacterium]
MQHFYEKEKKSTMLPQAVCVSSGETPGLINHRVSRVNYTTYAVTDPAEHFVSGRAKETRSFAQKNSLSEFFCAKDKKSTMLPQAILPFTG